MIKSLNLMVIPCEWKTYGRFPTLLLEVDYKIYQELKDFLCVAWRWGDTGREMGRKEFSFTMYQGLLVEHLKSHKLEETEISVAQWFKFTFFFLNLKKLVERFLQRKAF